MASKFKEEHYVPVNGDPTSVLVSGTRRYPDKINEDWSPVNKDSLSG